jgi:hypothetical protein
MSVDPNQWQQNNQRYLSAALAWLRLRLARIAQVSPPAPASVSFESDPRSQPSGKWRFWDKTATRADQPRGLLPPAPDCPMVTDEQLAQAFKELEAAEAATPAPAMIALAESFNLSRFEEILLLCAAMELDTGIAAMCADAPGGQQPYPTFALAMRLFDEPVWSALSPEGPLRHWRLLEINQPGAQPLTTSALRTDERIVNFMKGYNYLDDRLASFLLPMRPLVDLAADGLPLSQRHAASAILNCLQQSRTRRLPVFQLLGSDAASKQLVAQQVVAELGLQLYRLPADLMPGQAGDLETLARLAERETALWPLAIYLETREQDREKHSDVHGAIDRFLARSNGVFFLDVREPRRDLSRETLMVDITRPTASEQMIAWTGALGAESNDLAALLASQFNLSFATIRQIAAAPMETTTDESTHRDLLWQACLAATRPGLEGLAERIEQKRRGTTSCCLKLK